MIFILSFLLCTFSHAGVNPEAVEGFPSSFVVTLAFKECPHCGSIVHAVRS